MDAGALPAARHRRGARWLATLALAHYRQLREHIIDGRTVLMHHRLFMPLRAGRVFVAVGASHLYAEQGLLAMLERDGFRVTRIW